MFLVSIYLHEVNKYYDLSNVLMPYRFWLVIYLVPQFDNNINTISTQSRSSNKPVLHGSLCVAPYDLPTLVSY